MARNLWLGCIALAALAFCGPAVRAQDAVLEELYGRGVHSFFGRDYRAAHQHLTDAINSGSRDPRAYYFRALTYARLGRPDEARSDFQTGATLEVTSGEPFPIGRSLERIQGRD